MDQHVGEDAILASSTSCILPSMFTEKLKHRSHCLVVHPVCSTPQLPVYQTAIH